MLISKNKFFSKYNVNPTEFENISIGWNDLEAIHIDYCKQMTGLENYAVSLLNDLMKSPHVHSVRYRIKDPEHLIEKIIRKKILDPDWIINNDNYIQEVTDLIGLRALHLYKSEWIPIHDYIIEKWNLKDKPTANYREGDSKDFLKGFEEKDCKIKVHKFGYRSVHYIIETIPAKVKYYAEIQVRTIFEEAWSEIDHTIRYPYDQDNPIFGQYLLILNRLAGSADEMGSFIKFLKNDLKIKEKKYNADISDRDNLIEELKKKISKLELNKKDSDSIREGLDRLKKPNRYEKMESLSDYLKNINSSVAPLITLHDIVKTARIQSTEDTALLRGLLDPTINAEWVKDIKKSRKPKKDG